MARLTYRTRARAPAVGAPERPRGQFTAVRIAALTMLSLASIATAVEKASHQDLTGVVLDYVLIVGGLLAVGALGVLELRHQQLVARVYRDAVVSDVVLAADRMVRDRVGQARGRIERVLRSDDQLSVRFQPIVRLADAEVVGYEALSRFPRGGPEEWFSQAHEAGLGPELELHAISKALRIASRAGLDGRYVSVNCSPGTLMHPRLSEVVSLLRPVQVVVELTEQVAVTDYRDCRAAVDRLRETGVRLAIDDAGSGYASMKHILRLAPEIIKLDRMFVDNLRGDPAQCAIISSLVEFSKVAGCAVVAEGIETQAQLEIVQIHGVTLGQGYLLGRGDPVPLSGADRARLRSAIARLGPPDSPQARTCRALHCRDVSCRPPEGLAAVCPYTDLLNAPSADEGQPTRSLRVLA
jgi:EAL domain-containing protein (putative c-di-GMP-specific phosphodiesterase class I)